MHRHDRRLRILERATEDRAQREYIVEVPSGMEEDNQAIEDAISAAGHPAPRAHDLVVVIRKFDSDPKGPNFVARYATGSMR